MPRVTAEHSGIFERMRDVYTRESLTIFSRMQPEIQLERRSHLSRREPGKHIRITDADVRDIFEPLSRHRRLSTRQLVAFGARHPILPRRVSAISGTAPRTSSRIGGTAR